MEAGRFARHIRVAAPGEVDPDAARFIRRYVTPCLRAAFRPRLEGIESLPTDGPFVLVTNHAGGMGIAEIFSVITCWLEQLGEQRRIAGFALPLGFVVWPFSALHALVGTVPSTYEAGRDALSRGVPLLIFPGGDHESLKPVWQNSRVDFGGRVGFLRLAREMNVPVVPMGIRNGALTAPIVLRAKWLAWALVVPRLLGVKRWGLTLFGVAVAGALWTWLPWAAPAKAAAVWLWLGSPLVFMPVFPATLRFRIGEPIEAGDLFPDGDEATLRVALERVQGAVQALVRG